MVHIVGLHVHLLADPPEEAVVLGTLEAELDVG
jgi:hypothetical protein